MRSDEILKWVRGPAVLDVGCAGQADDERSWEIEAASPEWVHGRLVEQFEEVFGIDISEERLDLLRKRGIHNVYNQSAESFEFDKRFDTIVAGEVIEHLANPGLFLERARAHLGPEGRIILTTPNTFSAIAVLYATLKYPRTCSNPEHTAWFCPQTLSVLAERCGLVVLHWNLIDDYPNVPGLSAKSRIFRAALRRFRRFIPGRIRSNAMLFVLGPAAAS